jgi:hypothetical protein
LTRVGPALLVAVAALAAHSAWVLAHLALAGAPRAAWPIALVPVLLWSVGMLRRSAATLLAGVPVSWALLAYLDDPRRFSGATGATEVATLVAYLVAAALYLTAGERVAQTPATVAWHPLDDAPERSPRPLTEQALPWLAGALVVGPGLGLLLAPGLEANLRQGFGPLAGLVGAGLVVLGTLLGLAFATDVHRQRPARTPDVRRALRLAAAATLVVVVALLVR